MAESLAKRVKQAVKKPIRFLAKDWALGFAFPRAYAKVANSEPVDPSKVLFIDVKESQMPDAFSVIYPYVRDELGMDARFIGLGQHQGISWITYYKKCLALMEELATARAVFLCDACDVVSCVSLRPETKVAQLWHACGAFKKWGVSTANLKFGGTRKEIERHPFYKNLSLVTVSSSEVAWAYREAMMLEDTPEVVQALGVSRTDVFFDEDFLSDARIFVEQAVPQAASKKILLYAPTFRGHASEAKGPDKLDIRAMKRRLAGEWVLLIKHHPFVKHPPAIPDDCRNFAFMVPDVPTEKLLCTADACISDYSSIVFEYSLFNKPMIFFAYDFDDYGDWRGFYYDYDEIAPGPVVKTSEELIDCLLHLEERFNEAEIASFRNKFMSACDGHATERICEQLLSPTFRKAFRC